MRGIAFRVTSCRFNIPLIVLLCVIDCVLQVGMNTDLLSKYESLLPGEVAGLDRSLASQHPCWLIYICACPMCICV